MSLKIKLRITPAASHLNLNHKTHKPTSILQKPIFYSTQLFTPLVFRTRKMVSLMVIKISLIDPDDGVLVDLVVLENQIDLKASEAERRLQKVQLTKIDLEWVHVISEGWASPLKGFTGKDEYLQSLHFNSLSIKDGNGSVVNMSLPIVLAIDDETKEKISGDSDVALVGSDRSNVPKVTSRLHLRVPSLHSRERKSEDGNRQVEKVDKEGGRRKQEKHLRIIKTFGILIRYC